MYSVRPPALYMLDEVSERPFAAAAAEQIRAALPPATPMNVVAEAELGELAQTRFRDVDRRMGMFDDPGDPEIFLSLARYDGRLEERLARIRQTHPEAPAGLLSQMLGYRTMNWFNSGREEIGPCPDHVCRPAWRLNLMRGCPHRCFYCGLGRLLVALVNVDEFVAKLGELAGSNPWQKTFLYDDSAEAFALEPEYGAVRAMARFFARTEDRYLIIHTKSANVDFLRDLDHRGHTIIVWSLTPRTQSQQMEQRSATMIERIEAARKCQEWGYTIRYKFKPIVPVIGWREEIAEMVRLLFERTRPDVISLFMLAWMDYEELIRLADTNMLDPEFLAAAEAAAPELGSTRVRPFPHHMRRLVYEFCYQEIRRHDPEVPVSLSTETLDMWRDLSPLLGLNPANYPCGCGVTATPHLKQLPCSPWSVAKPVPVSVG